MIWNTCFAISVILLLVSTVITYLLIKMKKKDVNPFYLIFSGMFLSVTFLFFPINCGGIAPETFVDALTFMLLSLHNAIQTFTINVDLGEILKTINYQECKIQELYSLYTTVFVVFSPILTFSFVLTFLGNVSAYIKFACSYFKDMYVFSELNEKSLTLAKDIKKNHKKAVIVFTESENDNSWLIDETESIDAILLNCDILSFNFKSHSSKKMLCFFAIDGDERRNTNIAIAIISKYNNLKNGNLYVFSSSVESELLLSNVPKGNLQVRRVNPIRSMIYNYLNTEGDKLFSNYQIAENGDKVISTVVIGFGQYGKELVKALAWFCQFDSYRIEINIFDKDKTAEERFVAQVPALMDGECNGVYKKGCPQYKIVIHSGVEIETKAFTDIFTGLLDTSYVFVDLGSSDENIKTAAYIRMIAKRMGIIPVIKTIAYNSKEKNLLKDVKSIDDETNNRYEIDFIGDLDVLFSEETILKSKLEEKGFEIHRGYSAGNKEKEANFWTCDYCYSSSVATAIRANLRDKFDIKHIETTENMSDTEKEKHNKKNKYIEEMEHCAWDVYMRTEGFVFGEQKNHLAKTHHYIKPFVELPDEVKEIDARITNV